MTRINDSPELFGVGIGTSTTRKIICEWCNNTYEDKNDIVSTLFTDFAGKQVCECCFDKIEDEILSRMSDILKWYELILKENKKNIIDYENLLKVINKNK